MTDMIEDTCKHCGAHIGWGIPEMHLGVCDGCRNSPERVIDKALQKAQEGQAVATEWQNQAEWFAMQAKELAREIAEHGA